MSEKQNIEFKSIWKDDYLKWICGFANAQGGRIYIGKDDAGQSISHIHIHLIPRYKGDVENPKGGIERCDTK